MQSQLMTRVVALAFAGTIVLAACDASSAAGPAAPSEAPTTQPATTTVPTTREIATPSEGAAPVREGAESSEPGTVSRSQAEQAALDAVGSGRVTWSGPENDRGAAWEVEVTRPDGSEIDVLVAPNGSIIR